MGLIATLLVIFGLGIYLLGAIFFIIAAFRQSLLWGLLVLFISPASIIFLFMHWHRARNPFFLMLWGLGFVMCGHLVFHAALPWPLG